jgi:hypothetical protein
VFFFKPSLFHWFFLVLLWFLGLKLVDILCWFFSLYFVYFCSHFVISFFLLILDLVCSCIYSYLSWVIRVFIWNLLSAGTVVWTCVWATKRLRQKDYLSPEVWGHSVQRPCLLKKQGNKQNTKTKTAQFLFMWYWLL